MGYIMWQPKLYIQEWYIFSAGVMQMGRVSVEFSEEQEILIDAIKKRFGVNTRSAVVKTIVNMYIKESNDEVVK